MSGRDSDVMQGYLSSRILELLVGAQDIQYVNVSAGEIEASTNQSAVGTALSSVDESWATSAVNPTQSATAIDAVHRPFASTWERLTDDAAET